MLRRLFAGRWPIYLLLLIGLGISLLPLGTASTEALGTMQLNGFTVDGRFLKTWRGERSYNDSIMINGLPISDKRAELSATDGKVYQVQWFERARFEEHPDEAKPNDVQLGLLGSVAAQGRKGETPFQAVAAPTNLGVDVDWFKETSHIVRGPFRDFWWKYGGGAQFGYPISEQFADTIAGKRLTVQYFERARFELHPNDEPQVTLGLLGVEQYKPGAAIIPTPIP